ncbi:O-methyltransferase-domain-containing protein [Schizophyllum amplum]|uniref:O-methyltransferase-domain-containing protein n=1 Tax=Schizophyllum amplum TaxID=97359 RepID=A0A550CEX1_9AGAR|nr:O-methyltransferase-domain-containing protein [Auriculariopsis ampla]
MTIFWPGEHANFDTWAASEAYHARFLVGEPDEALTFALANADKNGLPEIAVSAAQGKYLQLLVRALGAKRVIEVGTLGAYSTIWMARGLPKDGKLLTFELSEKHAKVARENLAHADLADRVEVVVGPAADSLAATKGDGTFDFAFIDAEIANNVKYMKECKRLVKSGGVIIVDNVVQNGLVADEAQTETWTTGARDLLKYLETDEETEATTVPTADGRGFDGWMFVLRK